MDRGKIQPAMLWLTLLLLIGLAQSQNKAFDAFDWRPLSAPHPTTYHPYQRDNVPTTISYDSRHQYDSSPQSYTGLYEDNSRNYDDYSHTRGYPKSEAYKYPGDDGSYESYGYGGKNDHFDVEVERYGGFGGTGDTRGFGAYDYPKKVQEVPQDLHQGYAGPLETDYPDMMRIGDGRSTFYRKMSMVHPLPPPL